MCPRCGSDREVAERMPSGPHHARLACADCGRFVRWLPAPRVAVDELILPEPWDRSTPLPALVGTPKQVAFAESIRRPMLRKTWMAGERHLSLCMATIVDSTWFIANRNAPTLDDVRWPREWMPRRNNSESLYVD